MSETPAVTTDVGTRLLFENDRVRVWDLSLEPGDGSGLHRHTNDYFYVVIGGGTLARGNPDGSRGEPRTMIDGEVHFRSIEDADVHEAINVGETTWRNIVVELVGEA